MRASDIVYQLATVLPKFVDDFTTQMSVASLTRSGTTVTVETDVAHSLAVGQAVNITGAETPLPCSITRSGILATLVTDQDHDLTENAGFDVQIDGAAEAGFNGTFTLNSVPNRRTVTFIVDDSGPTTATGSPVLLNGASPLQQYNGLRGVTATPTTTTFEYEIAEALPTPAQGSIVVKAAPRISTVVTFERILDAYTAQNPSEAWMFVVLGDALANKNRAIDTDATDNIQPGNYFNQKLIQQVGVYVIIPTKGEIGGSDARDRCEELVSPICQSLLGVRFPSLVENSNNPLMISGHGFQAYNSAFYAHQYTFEATLQLGESDIYVPGDDVAFRDIDLTTGLDIGTATFDTSINLDDDPL